MDPGRAAAIHLLLALHQGRRGSGWSQRLALITVLAHSETLISISEGWRGLNAAHRLGFIRH
jgi:hypothetical protein